jgi:uncharacterized protein (TIGR02453 family)
MDEAYFRPELFGFLRQLRENNDREWFQTNRDRYELAVREPFLRFIADFGPLLERISPHFVADPRPSGGSLFRIHRDTRFSKDKSPYKTAASAHFRHVMARDVHAPGFYLHLEPGRVFAGVGLWHPDPPTLTTVRDAIVADPCKWERASSDRAFAAIFTAGGDRLKRPPTGYDPKHPFIEDLKRKEFVASAPFSEEDACRPDFMDRFAETCRVAVPFMAFLTGAVGLAW